MNNKSIDLYGDGIGKVDYVSHMGSDLTVVNSARVSFGVEKEKLDAKDKRLINYLIRHKHTSTLEHCLITFRFTVPLYVRSQHHRHRTWSYNEISRRYTDVNIKFYEPNSFRTQHKSNRQASNSEELINPEIISGVTESMEQATSLVRFHHAESLSLFHRMIEAGVCREQARGILPQNMYTEWYWSGTLMAFARVCNLRCAKDTQWETQQIADLIDEQASKLFPVSWSALRNE